MSWSLVKLSDLIEVMHQGINTAADNVIYADCGVPIIQSKHLKDRTVEFCDTKFLSEGDVQKYQSKYFARKDDILFANIGTIGKSVIVASDNEFMFAWNVFVIRVKREMIDVLYLKLFLDRLLSINYYDRFLTGGTVKFVNKKVMGEIEIPLPPLEEQKRIAAILDKADAIRRKRQQAIKLADDFLRSVFLEMFGDPVTNPKGWDKCCIGDVCEVQGGLQVSTKREGLPLLKPYLRVANVLRNKLDLSEIKFMNVTEAEASRIALKQNDILVVEGHGNKDEIGRCAIWNGDIEDVIHQNHLIRVRVKAHLVTAQLVNDYINSSGGRSQMLRSSNTTSGLNTISTGIVKSTEMYLPPIDMQISYERICKKVSFLLSKVLSSKDASNENFLSLSKKAFSGVL